MSKKSIFGNQTYMDYEFKFNTFPVYFALLPMSYVIPTVFIVNYTIFVFMEHYLRRKEFIVNSQIFLVVSMAHIVNLLSFFFDYLSNRFPATGMMTSWCASHNYQTLLIFILTSHFYLDYLAMGFPFFMSVLRLIFMVYPNTHKQVINKLLKIALPCISLYPIFNTFFMFPATGECRQLYPPYEFGAIFIHYYGEITGFSNSPFLLANIAFWMGSTISINIMVIFLVAQARNRGSHHVQYKSRKSRRAELSVTLTTFAMILSFLMRGACLIVYLTIPSVASWLAIIRPLGSDAEVVVSPWVFYLTHPAFRRKKRQSTITNLLSFFFDYLSNRFPATGMMTSWCASHNYQTLLIFILTSHFYLDYLAMGFPFFMSVLRLIFMVYPNTHKQVISKLLKIALPCISLYPIFNTFFMFPATGECRQLYPPYEFGAIFIHYYGEITGFSNSPFLLANIAFWMGSTISINIMVIFLVAQARNRGSHHVQYKSRKSRRAELSVTLTTFAMILSFFMRGACLIVYLTIPSVASWLAIIRPLGSDAEVVVSPWVFYLTHPAFRRKKRQSTITVCYSISLGSGGGRK